MTYVCKQGCSVRMRSTQATGGLLSKLLNVFLVSPLVAVKNIAGLKENLFNFLILSDPHNFNCFFNHGAMVSPRLRIIASIGRTRRTSIRL